MGLNGAWKGRMREGVDGTEVEWNGGSGKESSEFGLGKAVPCGHHSSGSEAPPTILQGCVVGDWAGEVPSLVFQTSPQLFQEYWVTNTVLAILFLKKPTAMPIAVIFKL